MRFQNIFAVPLLFAAAACGSLASHTDEPSTLATIHGEVTNPQSLPVGSSAFRVAVVWGRPPADGGTNVAHVAQETSVTPVFPAQFTLDITELPPADTILSSPNNGSKFAYGTLVAYEDLNGNGKLDLVDLNATSFVDKIVAATRQFTLIYIESFPPDPVNVAKLKDDNGVSPTLGYNFYVVDDCNSHGSCNGSKPGFTWLPPTSAITLTISNDPQLSTLMCASEATGVSEGGPVHVMPPGQYPDSFPAKGDPNVVCGPDNREYVYSQCTDSRQGLCGAQSFTCDYTRYAVPDGQNPPAGWPCGQ